MSEVDYAGLRRLAENAGPGPWAYSPRVMGLPSTTVTAGDEHVGYIAVGYFREAVGCFVSAFDPPTVIALLDELERLRAIEAETVWEYVCDNYEYRRFATDADTAEKWRKRGYAVRRRTKAAPAGPWVPVPEQNPKPKGAES